MIVQFPITVANANALVGLGYTRIEVVASTDDGGTYTEVTSSVAEAAVLTSSEASNTFNMGGRLLKISIDGDDEVSILFASSPDNWTPAQVAARINEVVPGLASVDGDTVVLTSPTTGRVSSLLITYNDAGQLGWPAGTTSNGTNARPTLALNTYVYTFTDVAGTSSTRYKWRFSANGANPKSEYSAYVFGSAPPLSAAPISIGTALFAGLDGRAQKRRIVVVSDNAPAAIAGLAVGNELPLIVDSDDFGFVFVPLVQGAKVRVAIEGTTFVREFTVPDTASFDILEVMASAPDPFTVQVPAPFLIRRSI